MDQMELNLNPETAHNSLECHQLPLPLELNCQIFDCLKFGIQKKFIGGLGRGIYGMFRQKVLTKSKRLRNPKQNGWDVSNTNAIISSNGLVASDNTGNNPIVLAKKGFPILGELARHEDNFPGTILYYFEVTLLSQLFERNCVYYVGLSDGNGNTSDQFGFAPNSYCIAAKGIYYFLSGKEEDPFEWPNEVNGVHKQYGPGNVIGCGLLLNPANELSIFFTLNGILIGGQMSISPSVNCLYLYPTIEVGRVSLGANFGNDPAKPFAYNIEKCPGMGYH